MPVYFGHKNHRGLSVSPALQSLGIDLLRTTPHDVLAVAHPLVVQPGYTTYITHLPAFMKAYISRTNVPFNQQGYLANLPIEGCLPIGFPPVVIDYKGPIPSKFVDILSQIGFESIKMNRVDNILRFPSVDLDQIQAIRKTNPNATTPAPVNTINLQAMEAWIIVLKLVSLLLRSHTYPAFTDDDHFLDEHDNLTEELSKRKAGEEMGNTPKRGRTGAGGDRNRTAEGGDVEMASNPTVEPKESAIVLHKAKPPRADVVAWGSPLELPNTSGIFFPYVPELTSFDTQTVPRFIETALIQSLGNKPEKQLEMIEKIRSAWGVVGKTDAGNVMAHLCKVVHLSLRAQARAFPFVIEGVYQGCVMSGGRFWVGINGQVYKPLPFAALQEETGSYHMHSRVLNRILEIIDDEDIRRPDTMRTLRRVLLDATLTEDERDEVRKLAVNLHFKNDKFLAVNAQTISRILKDLTSSDNSEDSTLPMHHSALFSRDKVLVSLSAFGYQAPSFQIENCPKVSLTSSKPPQTLVLRQKPLDVACVDWKHMLESKEMRNNPRNLSRANRDRSIVGNDKTTLWGELVKLAQVGGGVEKDRSGNVGDGNPEVADDDEVNVWD